MFNISKYLEKFSKNIQDTGKVKKDIADIMKDATAHVLRRAGDVRREIAETRMRYGCKKLAAETSDCGGRIVRIWRPCRNGDQNRPCLRRLECALAGALGYTGLQLRFFCPG